MSDRRRFIAKGTRALTMAAAAAIVEAPHVIAQPKVQWRISTTATPTLDIQQGAAERLAKIVEEMSSGRFRIEVLPAGQIMPAFECFAAASQGKVEAFMASSYYWNQKERMPPGHDPEPAVEWFTTIPFGMNPAGMAAWFYQGDGLKLWEETYAAFNLVPRPGPGVAHRWPAGSEERPARAATSKGSKCGLAQVSAARSTREQAAPRSSLRALTSTPPSNVA